MKTVPSLHLEIYSWTMLKVHFPSLIPETRIFCLRPLLHSGVICSCSHYLRQHISQTDSGTNLASGDLSPGVNRPGSETDLHPVLRLRMCGAIAVSPPPCAGVALCYIRTAFPFNPNFLSIKS